MRRQVACEQDDVSAARQRRERSLDPFTKRLGAVNVAGSGDAQRRRHTARLTRGVRFVNGAQGYEASVGYSSGPRFPVLIDTMKRAVAALRDADVPAMLGGGLAVWARGGPPTEHDVDFYLREADAERGLQALVDAGMRSERPPEGWLFKAHADATLVDLIFRPSGGPIGDEHFQRAELLEVMAQPMLVASLDDVLTTKLLSLREQELDYAPVLESPGRFGNRSTGISSGFRRASRPSRAPSSPSSRNWGSPRRARPLRGFPQRCVTQAVKLPTVAQPQHVAAEHDLDRHAVELARSTRLSALARRERLAHHGELDVQTVPGQEEVRRERLLHAPVGIAREDEGARLVLPADAVLVEDPSQLPFRRMRERCLSHPVWLPGAAA
jgi:hypothetical protein